MSGKTTSARLTAPVQERSNVLLTGHCLLHKGEPDARSFGLKCNGDLSGRPVITAASITIRIIKGAGFFNSIDDHFIGDSVTGLIEVFLSQSL